MKGADVAEAWVEMGWCVADGAWAHPSLQLASAWVTAGQSHQSPEQPLLPVGLHWVMTAQEDRAVCTMALLIVALSPPVPV